MAKGQTAAPATPTDPYKGVFPLTTPLRSLVRDPSALASDPPSLLVEQDLVLNPTNEASWTSHISSLVASVDRQVLGARGQATERDVELLGNKLASKAGRDGYRVLVSVYERCLAHFPTSFGIWRDYLSLRQSFILGKPRKKVNLAAPVKRRKDGSGAEGLSVAEFLDTPEGELDEGERDLEGGGGWEGALNGAIGWDEWRALAGAHERAIMWLPNMPRLWLLYIQLLTHPSCPAPLSHSHARRTFDRALRALPHSLHERVWKPYLRWAETTAGGETCVRVWRRFLGVDPSVTPRYVKLLVSDAGATKSTEEDDAEDEGEGEEDGEGKPKKPSRALEAAKLLLSLARKARKGKYKSPDGKSPYQLLSDWLDICERFPEAVGLSPEAVEALPPPQPSEAPAQDASTAMVPHRVAGKAPRANGAARSAPETVEDDDPYDPDVDSFSPRKLDVSRLVRLEGLSIYKDQSGPLWTGLATYWTKRGEFDLARETFESGMSTVLTIRDFTTVFDAFAEFSEQYISSLMEAVAVEGEGEEEAEELDTRMKEFEELMDRRPFLVNEVLLRRNPNDVQEWEKRVTLFGTDDVKVAETYTKAIETVNPKKATANFHQLFVNFAKWYEEGGSAEVMEDRAEVDLESARKVFEKATGVHFKRVDDLAEIWIEWAEMEVRNEEYDAAIRVMQRATTVPKKRNVGFHDETLPVQARLFKSLKLWSFRVDLEESIGSVESTKKAYDMIFELKIANAQVVINFADFLEENQYWEESFKVYERGVDLFTYPVAFEIWNTYLTKFISRYGGTKLERARDLFEQALEKCPEKFVKPLFLLYANLEEEHGLAKRAMGVLERATEKVALADRFEMYAYYIAKATENFGLPATRPIYQRAIESLPDSKTAEMCLRFANLEQKLGEIDRARAIFAHASQFCDPRIDKTFWDTYHKFEIQHGSEDTFREMLRIKRAVQASFNDEKSYLAARAAAARASARVVEDVNGADAMSALDSAAAKPAFVPSKDSAAAKAVTNGAATAAANVDEIAIEDDEDEDDQE